MSSPSLITDRPRYDYKGYGGCASHCRLRLFKNQHADAVTAVVTELSSNPGTSITNMAAPLARQFCEEFVLDPDRLTVIEHYPEEPGRAEGFSRASFAVGPRGEFTDVEWSPLTAEEVAELTNTPVEEWRRRGGAE